MMKKQRLILLSLVAGLCLAVLLFQFGRIYQQKQFGDSPALSARVLRTVRAPQPEYDENALVYTHFTDNAFVDFVVDEEQDTLYILCYDKKASFLGQTYTHRARADHSFTLSAQAGKLFALPGDQEELQPLKWALISADADQAPYKAVSDPFSFAGDSYRLALKTGTDSAPSTFGSFTGTDSAPSTFGSFTDTDSAPSTFGSFTYKKVPDGVAITKCTDLESTRITVPGEIDGQPVISIEEVAFYQLTQVREIDLPDTLKHLGSAAFYRCYALQTVTLPPSLETMGSNPFFRCSSLQEIAVKPDSPFFSAKDGVLYNKDQTALLAYPEGKASPYSLPETVTTLGGDCFGYQPACDKIYMNGQVHTGLNQMYTAFPDRVTFFVKADSPAAQYAAQNQLSYKIY